MKGFWSIVLKSLIVVFAIIGITFTAVFAAMQFGLLNVRGSIDERNQFFLDSATSTLSGMPCIDKAAQSCSWQETPEWVVVSAGLTKDADTIARVSRQTGVSQRMIAATVVPEQVRFFTANREIFKRYFEPLKILGSLSQFSLGVSGIKEETAKVIEIYAASTTSIFYPGGGLSDLYDYSATTTEHDAALFNRLTDAHDHYYSYLYTALFIKEVEMQWQRGGFDISQNPEVVVTLFNIGFGGSHPNAAPIPAGSPIQTGGKVYSYGQLGANFYRSNELGDVFPK